MKIRILDNSIRYRLTKSEVQTLATNGVVVGETRFGPTDSQKLMYSLEAKEGVAGGQAVFNGHESTGFVSLTGARAVPDHEQIGCTQPVQATPELNLFLLMGQDFVCMNETVEDQSD